MVKVPDIVDDPKICLRRNKHNPVIKEYTDNYGNKLRYPVCTRCNGRLPN